MPESPLAAYLRSLGIQLPVTDSFSAMRESLPQPDQVPPTPPPNAIQHASDPAQASVLDSTSEQVMRRVLDALQSGEYEQLAMGATVNIPGRPDLDLAKAMPDLLKRTGRLKLDFRAPSLKRFEALERLAENRPVDWIGQDELLGAVGGQEDLMRKWHRGWGATSPGTDWRKTTAEANYALARYLEGKPFTREWAESVRMGNVGSKLPNLDRAYYSEAPLWSGTELDNLANPGGVPVIGKANAMADFMVGKPGALPIDRHAIDAPGAIMPGHIVNAEPKLDPVLAQLRQFLYAAEGLPTGSLTKTDIYNILQDAYARGLLKTGGGRDLRDTFAHMWEGVRAAKGLGYYGGTNELQRGMGLLEPNAMLDPERLYRASPFKTGGVR